jgi:hypothetical protein
MEGGKVLALHLAPHLAPFQSQGRQDTSLEPDRAGSHPILRRMLELEQAGNRELMRLRRQLAPLPPGLEIPRNGLGQQVALALRLIGSGACPPVLQLSQAGYDTHAYQASRHARLLAELASAMAALAAGLERLPDRPQVSLLTVSEFGRRLRQNGSGGTDHGAASIALLFGDQVHHPFLGSYPSLSNLDDRGDLTPALMPPQLYRQVLRGFWS